MDNYLQKTILIVDFLAHALLVFVVVVSVREGWQQTIVLIGTSGSYQPPILTLLGQLQIKLVEVVDLWALN